MVLQSRRGKALASTLAFLSVLLVPSSPASAFVRETYMQFNWCGNRCYGGQTEPAGEHLASSIAYHRPLIVTLNEVCYNQLAATRTQLANENGLNYQAVFAQTIPDGDPRLLPPCAGYGNALLIYGRADSALRLNLSSNGLEQRVLLCAHVVAPAVFRACVTHLQTPGNSTQRQTRDQQATEVARQLNTYLAGGQKVMIGADFNATPDEAVMSHFYEPFYAPGTGIGHFREVDGNCFNRTTSTSTCNAYTNRTEGKIDYIFTANTVWGIDGGSVSDSAHSDHDLLIGGVVRDF